MPRFPIQPFSYADLAAKAKPNRADAPEAFADELYDTQTFVNAGTASLTFFQNPSNDKTLTNLDASGVLQAGQYFIVHYMTVDVLFPAATSANTPAGNLNDVHILINLARATVTMSLATKPYGPWRVRSCHSGGAPVGFFAGAGAAAPAITSYGHIGPHDGGFCINGGLVIPPLTPFPVVMAFNGLQSLNTNNLPIQVGLYGVRYRRLG